MGFQQTKNFLFILTVDMAIQVTIKFWEKEQVDYYVKGNIMRLFPAS
jgi:hypothetical protein